MKQCLCRFFCSPQMSAFSLHQLVFLHSRMLHCLRGPHWHFDQQTMQCFDFPLIWQSGCTFPPQKYNLFADTCCALAFPKCHFQHTASRTSQMQLKLSLLFQILVSDLWPSFFPFHCESSNLPDKWCVNCTMFFFLFCCCCWQASSPLREQVEKHYAANELLLSAIKSIGGRLLAHFIHLSI